MPAVFSVAELILGLCVTLACGDTEVRFAGQTNFVVNETSISVIRLVIERIGTPANVTALLLLQGEDTDDFESTSAAARLLATETNKTVYIAVKDDDFPEADETFVFSLSLQGTFADVMLGIPNIARVTILSNDNAFGIISFNMSSTIIVSEARERKELVPLILIRKKGTYGTVTVTFEITAGPNSAEEDISPAKGTIVLPPGRAVVEYNLTILDDQIPENEEVFTVQLTSVEGGAEINATQSSFQLEIKKNDCPLRLAQALYTVPETVGVITVPVIRGKDQDGQIIGSDDVLISVNYLIITGNGSANALLQSDFIDLQPNQTIIFPPYVYEVNLKFLIINDSVPEIAESFQVLLLEDTITGDAVLLSPSKVQIVIEPNDKPYGVLSINSKLLAQKVAIDEDTMTRFDGITIVRNGGSHGNISVNWIISRSSNDSSAVTEDLEPSSGTLEFVAGQMMAVVPLFIVNDDTPEEAEAYLFRLLNSTIKGGAELDEPTQIIFYIQDSDDVYGLIGFHSMEGQEIESSPTGRFLSLSFGRHNGTVGVVQLNYTVLYIPAGVMDLSNAKDDILNVSSKNSVIFMPGQSQISIKLPIRNDAFLQNGASFLVQLDTVELINILPLVPSVSPRLADLLMVSLIITPQLANGEVGFTSNETLLVHEPENASDSQIYIALQRDGTDGSAEVFWHLEPAGVNHNINSDDLSPMNGSVKFLSGQNNATIDITVKSDDLPEINETWIISLDRASPENQIMKSNYISRKIIILQNDDPGGVFEFSSETRGPYFVQEGVAFELKIIRYHGALLKQFLRYVVEPKETFEFYGNTGVLEFDAGEREVAITLLARQDDVPELDEHYSAILSSHGIQPSKLGVATQVNITVMKNDDPHGVLQFNTLELTQSINESKDNILNKADFTVIRDRGTFGSVGVHWRLEPAFTNDVYPVQGVASFKSGESLKNITLRSIPDSVPEEIETFVIILWNITGGAGLGSALNATLLINKNDDPIYFEEPIVIRVQEGTVGNFTVVRNGSTDFVAVVVYNVESGGAVQSEGDFHSQTENMTLVFEVGEQTKTISVIINEDDIPETDETFYIVLLNSTGDAVVYQPERATVIIEANDDPNGIFSLDPSEKAVFEGMTTNFMIMRERGTFGNVSVSWQLFFNGTFLEPGQEFAESSGIVVFTTGEVASPVALHALPDGIPEFNETYVLRLLNVSGGTPGSGGQLSNKSLSVNVVIPFNDDPFGVFILDAESQEREVAEDVLSVEDMSYITNFTILRQRGAFGDVRVGWEILSNAFRNGLPDMTDLILVGTFPSSVEFRPHARRHRTGTDVLYFSGAEHVYGTVSPEYHPRMNNTITNFTLTAWVIPDPNTNGFIISKASDNGTVYYAMKLMTNESFISVTFCYNLLSSNITHVVSVTALKYMDENTWIHIIIVVAEGTIAFYLDGILLPHGIKYLKGETIADGPGILTVGATTDGQNRFTGLMQDVRIYVCKLDREEIHEIHASPAKADLHPISGYLEYRRGERKKSFIVAARDDAEEEGEESFVLKLTSVNGGARISQDNATARLRIEKSDNANGLFGFTGTCIPQTSSEGSTISCIVERTRGALDSVFVNYNITQVEFDHSNMSDFGNPIGTITFVPWQNSEVLNVHVLNDDLPELAEHFIISLVSAISGDGKVGSTPTSGASIDPEKASTQVVIKSSDHPYGLLQFSTGPPPGTNVIVSPAFSVPSVTVKEEVGSLRLLVVRAQGLLGNVVVAYQTVPLTAASPSDYQDTAGTLDFKPGEQYKYITINITDDSVPELPSSFKVVLSNSEKVAELPGVGTSGSGDGEVEFVLPAFHMHASLGIASEIIITIDVSDDAYGVFQFSSDSLQAKGTEPEGGHDVVLLQVSRAGGALSQVTLFWDVVSDPNNNLVDIHGNITFETGQTLADIVLQVASDDVPELDEELLMYISNVSKGRLGTLVNATVTVLADDDPYGVFTFSVRSRPIRVEEEDQNVTLTVERHGGFFGIAAVTYATVEDTRSTDLPSFIDRAMDENDYRAISGSIIFEANQMEANITIPILDDGEPERAESVFVQLRDVVLLKGKQDRPIAGSPRLGSKNDIIAQVIINANDDAFGTLQLSTSAVRVYENYVGPIINVTRTGGIFADVSVKFQALSMTARAGEDYSISSSDVILLEGETSKAVPIYLLNDVVPELEESFYVKLINETTGGAVLGGITLATITIEASDDPYGSFVFERTEFTVAEPESKTTKINLPVVRNAGTLGNVTVHWVATMNKQDIPSDLQENLGELIFTPGQTMQTLQLELLADDIPEIEEVIQVKLTHSTYGSSVGRNNVVNIIVPANDNPHGTVHFTHTVYRVQEPLERNVRANITVARSGGHFGQLRLLYSTSEIDILDLLTKGGQDLLSYYDPPVPGFAEGPPIFQLNVSQEINALHACAASCLKEQACVAFSFTDIFGQAANCSWIGSSSDILVPSIEFSTYRKNISSVATLLSNRATAGSDYEPTSGVWAVMHEGDAFANLSVLIQTDAVAELDEKFAISLLNVELLNVKVIPENQPTVGQPNISTVIIAMNGDVFGIFLLYIANINATEKGSYLEVREETRLTVQLVVDRSGGSLGEVTVEWSVVGGTARKNIDFIGDGEILTFAEGENKRIVTLIIVDDEEPEDNETIVARLTHTEGGSRILPSSDTVTIVILANDYVGGVVNFQASSLSVTGQEGETLLFWIERSSPGSGNITVDWEINGQFVQQNFVDIRGTVLLSKGVLNASLLVHILDDDIPEENEEYIIILSNVKAQGIPSTIAVSLDSQGYKANLTVEASDDPHGIVTFALPSRSVSVQEGNKIIHLLVNREFGSLGVINITYETVRGSLLPPNLAEETLAEPGLDFLHVTGFVIMEEGKVTTTINVTILEDDIPELQELFLVKLTSVKLIQSDSSLFPPRLDAAGQVSQITIDANDGVKGIIQWQSMNFEVNETSENLTLVLYRDRGTYGNVSLFYYPQNLKAQLGLDFNVQPMVIYFNDGERYKNVEIEIYDDDTPEGDEDFQIILANASLGLELGERITATVIISANDDGHGILLFNNTEHFFLKEPSAPGASESIAALHIIRNPPRGTFGQVSVQYIVTSMNGSDPLLDLTPTQGVIVLEDGVKQKIVKISAILDEESEMDEEFLVTLFGPTGGARLGDQVQIMITVLQNQAPLGLFSIFPVGNRTRVQNLEEGNRTLYFNISRSKGLENRVTVEWETQAGTADGITGDIQVLSILQSFSETLGSRWCFLKFNHSLFGIFLRINGSNWNLDALSTLHRWQGVFVPVQNIEAQNPTGCTSFVRNDVSYIIITHSGVTGSKASNNDIYRFTLQSELTLIQSLTVPESSDVKHFTHENQDYLIISSQVDTFDSNSKIYRWDGNAFILHQNLPTRGASGLALFKQGNLLYLAVSQNNQASVLFQWSDDQFGKPRNLTFHAGTHVSSITVGGDTYLVLGNVTTCSVHIWKTGQPFLKLVQSIPVNTVRNIHLFTPPSGFVHLLLNGENKSNLYTWNTVSNQFTSVLKLPPSNHMVSVTAPSRNGTKILIASVGSLHSWIYELASVSNQSDFIPGSEELVFEPGDKEAVIAVNILDDEMPEDAEFFTVRLINAKGGAEIGFNDHVTIVIQANDDAHGIVGFAQSSLSKQVEELEQDSKVTLSVERLRGTYRALTVHWVANGNVNDIFPTSGMFTFLEGQTLSSVFLVVQADDIPEGAEVVTITLVNVTTMGVQDQAKGAVIDTNKKMAILTVLPNDSPYGVISWHLDSANISLLEPEFDSTDVTLTIVREQGFVGDVLVQYRTQPNVFLPPINRATENQDYNSSHGAVILKEGSTQALIRFTIFPDNIPELYESFLVNITSVELIDASLVGGKPRVKHLEMELAEITIEENDDPRGIIQFNISRSKTVVAYEMAPPGNLLRVPVIRSAGTFGEVNVLWEALLASASFADFTPANGSLAFADGTSSTILEITIVDDNLTEILETFSVVLTQVMGGAKIGEDNVVTVNIPNNDSPVGVFGFEERSVVVEEPKTSDDPAGLVSFTVSRKEGHGSVQIVWQVDESAIDDLVPLSGTLNFNQTETTKKIVLHIYADALLEGQEQYVIRLISASNNAEISPVNGVATVIILGDSASSGTIAIAASTRHILIGEPSSDYNGTAQVILVRGPGNVGDVTVNWIIFPAVLNEFAEMSGTVFMRDRQATATILLQAINDDIPEEKQYYQLQLTGVSGSAIINDTSNSANITMAASDFPYGRFSFSHEELLTFENGKQANVTFVRSHGSLGHVHLWYQMYNGTALGDVDFASSSGQLLFEPGEQIQQISVDILDDSIPEGPEDFFVKILKVELQSDGSHDFAIRDPGLQPDQPPILGNISSIRIVIRTNDNAEGIIEFEPQFLSIEVEEDIGMLGIPLVRKMGTYGIVTADFVSHAATAQYGADYILPNGTITFYHGQNQSFINVTIIDDIESESEEQFEIQLIAANGGAILGNHLTSRVTIRKSDSISGLIRFQNLTQLVIPNPNTPQKILLVLERVGGHTGDVQIKWNILGPNSETILPSSNADIGEPVNGTFYFKDGEVGNRIIELNILPHGELEIQETFIIQLGLDIGEAEIDRADGKVFLTVQKFGNPNGIVQFTEESLYVKTYLEPSNQEELINVSFIVTRTKGIMGDVKVHWQLWSDSDMTGDVLPISGSVTILDMQQNAEINIKLLADDIPELDEVYTIRLVSVEGGADLDEDKDWTRFIVPANDDPYGLFAIYPERQSVIVESDLNRYYQINITRHGGTFQDVIVEYKLIFHREGFATGELLGNVLVRDGANFAIAKVPISNRTFLRLDSAVSVKLMNVTLVSGNTSTPPKLLTGTDSANVFVPEEAVNSQVGFDSLVLQVSDISAGTCWAVISRNGVYGLVVIEWRSGYPNDKVPVGFTHGYVKPAFGSIVLSHGEKRKPLLLTVPTTNFTGEESFAIHLIAVHSNFTGKAELRSGFTVAEIEPFGVFQLAPHSRQIRIEEDVGVTTLHIQRLFGFRGNETKLTYSTTAGSAKPDEDFECIQRGELVFTSHQTEATIDLLIINDHIPEPDEVFYLNLSSIEVLDYKPNNTEEQTYLNPNFSVSSITIIANDATKGVLSIGPTVIHALEGADGKTVNVMLHIRRTLGFTGIVSVSVVTFGEKKLGSGIQQTPFQTSQQNSTLSWAKEGEDFEDEALNVTLQDEEKEIDISIHIFDDNEPEGQEFFFVYLTDPGGGVQIVEGKDEHGLMSFMKIVILGNDVQNGIIGFAWVYQSNPVLDEDSDNRELRLAVERQKIRSFEDVTISWRVTFKRTDVILQRDGVDLANELMATSGTILCLSGETQCPIAIEIKPDQIPESETWFLVEIYEVGAGALINDSARFLNITILESDNLHASIYFTPGSWLTVVHQKATFVILQVVKNAVSSTVANVSYQTQGLRKGELMGQTLISPAIAGMDFVKSEGILTFQPGQLSITLNIVLTPELTSSNLFPKRFQVVLYNPTAGVLLDEKYNMANITIVTDADTQFLWVLANQLYQPLDDELINQILQKLQSKLTVETTGEQLSAVMKVFEKVLEEGERKPLSDTGRELLYNSLCALLDPTRMDTKGFSHLSEVTERFAFSLLTDVECGSPGQRGKTVLDTCQYLTIQSYHWYPQQINGHKVEWKNGDSLQVPERLLDVSSPPSLEPGRENCQRVQFTEYSSQQWFQTNANRNALNNKIFSASLKDRDPQPLADNNTITYRIHSPESRIVPQTSACLLWNKETKSWSSSNLFCRVVFETNNFVECACSHMSTYTATALIDELSFDNEAFFSAAFICISGLSLAILSHLLCSGFSMFAAKLLMHMMVACLGTQISFLMSVYLSRELSNESCSALGLVMHYLYLCQFSWMLIQSVNFWKVLVMNDEHTDRHYLLFFALSWGLPAFVVALLVIILRGAYNWSMQEVYGTIHGDVCFIPNMYAALAAAALVPLLCLVGVLVIFIYIYQIVHQWKSYDDIFRGKANGKEVPLVLYLFTLISLTWLWGGLYMAYRHFWMLVLYVIFNILQGLYVFVVYVVLHNQLCWPVKASYSMEINGHPSPGSTYLTTGSGAPSVGGEISKSTQNLITAMEEIPADWEQASLRTSSQASSIFKQSPLNGNTYGTKGDYGTGNLVGDEESQEFDDLIFALKTGAGLSANDNESYHGSQDGRSIANSQIVELRRIPIADTHL
ncbi:adhesion G-protein coupled receptor V1 [Amblyraja radiata]|uniref:adhesion G-protein coupled receptor V1 n=1 Tax=Amblyraja radiata TaxID=386614 RepID=UPI00140334D3|nr:adhesion G-protein coupled receptor V1 [Amblyraja radiata]